jgi:hypothetical protein
VESIFEEGGTVLLLTGEWTAVEVLTPDGDFFAACEEGCGFVLALALPFFIEVVDEDFASTGCTALSKMSRSCA